MQVNIHSILLVLAIVCFLVSVGGIAYKGDKLTLIAAGLALWALSVLVGSA